MTEWSEKAWNEMWRETGWDIIPCKEKLGITDAEWNLIHPRKIVEKALLALRAVIVDIYIKIQTVQETETIPHQRIGQYGGLRVAARTAKITGRTGYHLVYRDIIISATFFNTPKHVSFILKRKVDLLHVYQLVHQHVENLLKKWGYTLQT